MQFGGQELRQEDQSAESVKNQMTVQEWEKVFEMSQDKNLYHNLCTSLFPTIHGVSNTSCICIKPFSLQCSDCIVELFNTPSLGMGV